MPIRKWRCAAPTPNSKSRFAYIERALAAKGRSLEDASLEEMDALWDEAKIAGSARGRAGRTRASADESG